MYMYPIVVVVLLVLMPSSNRKLEPTECRQDIQNKDTTGILLLICS